MARGEIGVVHFFALSYFSLYLDYYTQAIVDNMVDLIQKQHGYIINGQEVIRIDAPKRQIWVKESQNYTYDQLIWAADLNMLYSCLDANQ